MTQTFEQIGPNRYRESFGRHFEDFTVGDVYEHPLGRTILAADNVWFTCLTMNTNAIHFDAAVAAYRGRGIVRQIIHDFKYGRQIHLRHLVARWLYAAFDDERLRGREFDIIVPVPLHPTRRRERGFNQAGLLAELLGARISIRCKAVLRRIRYTTTQTALDRAERIENLHNAFRLRKNADVRGLHVLLIDDVLTTGSTLSECARVLKRAGAISVYAATAARA